MIGRTTPTAADSAVSVIGQGHHRRLHEIVVERDSARQVCRCEFGVRVLSGAAQRSGRDIGCDLGQRLPLQGFAGRVIVDVNATDTAFKKIRRAGRSRLVWHWSAGESASAGYLMPNQRPSFALRPWRLVGILVARAILRLAAVMPIARFHENVRPGASFTPAVLHVETTSRDDPLH